MTVEPLKLSFDQKTFDAYCKKIGKMQWSPIGVTLHTTFNPSLAKVDGYLNSKKYTEEQLVDNWWQTYKKNRWYSGPHIFAFRDKIVLGTPLTLRGTHSPSYNKNRFGLELVGDYTKEKLPDTIRSNAVHAFATIYKYILKKKPDVKNFTYHGEDPKTSHSLCPGKMVGKKEQWVEEIIEVMKMKWRAGA